MSAMIQAKLVELLEVAKKHGLEEMVWKDGDVKIAFRRSMTEVPAYAGVEDPVSENGVGMEDAQSTLEFVRSPMVGTFRRSAGKGRPPMVMVGNHIKPGEPMGIVECMKLPTDVVSFSGGEIKEILVEDGQAVEYGQPLFSVEPTANGTTK